MKKIKLKKEKEKTYLRLSWVALDLEVTGKERKWPPAVEISKEVSESNSGGE